MPAYADARRQAILDILESAQTVSVRELSELTGVSKVTIRSDLDALAKDGKLKRTHGGALSYARVIVPSIQDARLNVNVEAKRAIARVARSFVKDGASILVDTGTTGLELVRQLEHIAGLTIITADMTIADFVDKSMPEAEVIILGGALRKRHRYTSGALTLATLEMLAPDIAFVCPTSVSLSSGFCTNHEPMAELKAHFMHSTNKRIVLLDSSKLNTRGLYKFAKLTDADIIIVDKDTEGQLEAGLKDSATQLIVTEKEMLNQSI